MTSAVFAQRFHDPGGALRVAALAKNHLDLFLGPSIRDSFTQAQRAPYMARTPAIYAGPADRFLSPLQRTAGWTQRVRSTCMNLGLGGHYPSDYRFRTIFKQTPVTDPAPAGGWVFLDGHARPQKRADRLMNAAVNATGARERFSGATARH